MDLKEDKSTICVSFILSILSKDCKIPQYIGLSGIQGIGKSTLGSTLAQKLSTEYNIRTLVTSIDDFYLSHSQQLELAQLNQSNKLVQSRGLPGTHDILLARRILSTLEKEDKIQIPIFDKSAHHGSGDRLPQNLWKIVDQTEDDRIRVVIIEGWCLGYSPLSDAEVEWKRNQKENKPLINHQLEHLLFINEKLAEYEEFFNSYFDGFIHIYTEDLSYVYDWREEQEENLRQEKGQMSAMSPKQVIEFVDNFVPVYLLYNESLQKNGIRSCRNASQIKQLRLQVDKKRKVINIQRSL